MGNKGHRFQEKKKKNEKTQLGKIDHILRPVPQFSE